MLDLFGLLDVVSPKTCTPFSVSIWELKSVGLLCLLLSPAILESIAGESKSDLVSASAKKTPSMNYVVVETNGFNRLIPVIIARVNHAEEIEKKLAKRAEYLRKTVIIPKDFLISLEELFSIIDRNGNVDIVITGKVENKRTHFAYKQKNIRLLKGRFSILQLLEKALAYMQEIGIPSEERHKWHENRGKSGYYPLHKVLALLYPNRIEFRLVIVGEQKWPQSKN